MDAGRGLLGGKAGLGKGRRQREAGSRHTHPCDVPIRKKHFNDPVSEEVCGAAVNLHCSAASARPERLGM